MEDINTYLKDLGIDTTSRIRGVQDAGALSYDENTYRRIIGELTGEEDVNVGDNYARMTFMYLIGDALESGVPNLLAAEEKAVKYVDAHPWILAKPEYEYEAKSTVDALGQPKQRKGAKKDAAIAFWNAHKDDYSTRSEWIEALMEAVGLTKAAASTYHYNLNTGKWSQLTTSARMRYYSFTIDQQEAHQAPSEGVGLTEGRNASQRGCIAHTTGGGPAALLSTSLAGPAAPYSAC